MLPELTPFIWAAALGVSLIAGFVKGAVGFAMPMIMISGLGSFLSPELALAGLILPTLFTNVLQAFRGGLKAAVETAKTHWRYVTIILVMIVFSAQLVAVLPPDVLLLIIGVPVVFFALIQLAGLKVTIAPQRRRSAEIAIGGFAGFLGGLSGVWGPPTVIYLTALNTPKDEQLRAQGIFYGLGAVVLTGAHIESGIFNAQTAPFSALMLIPAFIGMLIGMRVSNKLDQQRFRRWTLVVLTIAGLNLVRRGLMG